MCGIFAYAGRRPPEPVHLAAAALGASRRGPHGHGWVARNPGGGTVIRADLGRLDPRVPALPADATTVLGHARMATVGQHDDLRGLQPLITDATRPAHAGNQKHYVAHNGNVYNPDDLAPRAVTDSAALATAYANARLSGLEPKAAIADVIDRADQRAWVLVVLDAFDGRLYGHRFDHPLYTCTPLSGGTYWSSNPCCPYADLLPGLAPFTTED